MRSRTLESLLMICFLALFYPSLGVFWGRSQPQSSQHQANQQQHRQRRKQQQEQQQKQR